MPGYVALSDFVLDQLLGYQDMNEILGNIVAGLSARHSHFLGGSRQIGVRSAAYVDVPNYLDVELDGTNLGGLTKQARVEVRTANVGTIVTPRVRNVTDGSDAGVGAAYSTDTNWNPQTIALTLAAGSKTYRLQLTGDDANVEIFAIGYIEIFV